MGEHLVVYVDRADKQDATLAGQPVQEAVTDEKEPEMAGPSSSMTPKDEHNGMVDEEEPLIGGAECRICQEEDSLNNLESPCACSGSLKYAHRKCVERWCSEKGGITCEICHQPYQPGYSVPSRAQPEETTIDIGGLWQISGTPLDLHDPRFTEAERRLLETDYGDYNANGATFCRSATIILLALLLLRHALSVSDTSGDDEDPSAFFSLFMLRLVGFLVPCYIMIWAITILQQRRQQEEAAALAATQLAFVLQSAQSRGVQVTLASAAPAVPASRPHV